MSRQKHIVLMCIVMAMAIGGWFFSNFGMEQSAPRAIISVICFVILLASVSWMRWSHLKEVATALSTEALFIHCPYSKPK